MQSLSGIIPVRRNMIALLEKIFVAAVLFVSTGAVFPLLREGSGVITNPMHGNTAMQVLWLAVYLVTILLIVKHRRRVFEVAFKDKLILLLVGLAVSSVLWSGAPEVTLRRSIALVGTTVFGVYLAARYSARELLILLAWVLGLIAVMSLGAALALPAHSISFDHVDSNWRGIFENKNTLGSIMAISTALWVAIFFNFKWGRAIAPVFMALSVFLLIQSNSKTALVMLAMFLLLLPLYLVLGRVRVGLFHIVLLFLSAAALALLFLSNLDAIMALLGRDLSLTGRTVLWLKCWEMIKQNSLLGYGYNAFWLSWEGPSAYIWQELTWKPPHAHNGYLDLWLQLGLGGLALMATSLLANIIKIYNNLRINKLTNLFPFLFVPLIIVYNVPESEFLVRNSVFWILYVALSLQLVVVEQDEKSSPEQPKLALLTNIIAPYRLPLYKELARDFRVHVIYSGYEEDRNFWQQDPGPAGDYCTRRAWGFKVVIPRIKNSQFYSYQYLHINPGYLWELVKTKPDAVITHEMGFRTLVALIYGSLYQRPVWVGWEGTSHTERDIGPARVLVRWLIARWARRWISYGASSTAYLLLLGIKMQHILQIQNWVDEKLYTDPFVVPSLKVGPRPVFLYAGRLVGLKGLNCLVEAAARVQSAGYVFSLLLVGEGPLRCELEQYATEQNLPHVYFYGPVKPSEMPGIYKSADVFVFPTLQDVWGLVVNEALWSGLPVLCSKYAGCAGELLPPENIFNPLEVDDFASALKRALEGHIKPPSTNLLRTCPEVAHLISWAVKGVLAKQ